MKLNFLTKIATLLMFAFALSHHVLCEQLPHGNLRSVANWDQWTEWQWYATAVWA